MRPNRPAELLLVALLALILLLLVTRARAAATPARPQRLDGLTIAQWRQRAIRNRRTINRLRRVLLQRPQVAEAIDLAATIFGHGDELWRKARCETGGTFSSWAYNRSSHAAGLFQFLPQTWRTTPFARFSIWSPYASAAAAGWMHARGRGGEWACR